MDETIVPSAVINSRFERIIKPSSNNILNDECGCNERHVASMRLHSIVDILQQDQNPIG